MWNISEEQKSDDATLKWLKVNEELLCSQYRTYPNIIDSLSHSLFTLAGMRGKIGTMKYMLGKGANMNYVQTKT